jgi:penicillin-binding protein 2
MEITVSSGTGYSARVPGLIVAGKTGTAQNPHGDDDAWFIAYAGRPGEVPSIAIAVLVENGGHGAVAAAPVARKMILASFGMPDPDALIAAREAERAAARRHAGATGPALMRAPIPGGVR